MSTPIVLTDPVITFDDADTPGTPVDVSCHVRLFAVGVEVPETDVSTFCNPGGTVAGAPSYTVELSWTVHDDSASVLGAFVGKNVRAVATPHTGAAQELAVTFAFGPVNPANIGEWTPGGTIESETSHAVPASGAPAWAAS